MLLSWARPFSFRHSFVTDQPRSKRRIRFKIRTLLIIMALCSLPAWHWSNVVREYQIESAALEKIDQGGWGVIEFRESPPETSMSRLTKL